MQFFSLSSLQIAFFNFDLDLNQKKFSNTRYLLYIFIYFL